MLPVQTNRIEKFTAAFCGVPHYWTGSPTPTGGGFVANG